MAVVGFYNVFELVDIPTGEYLYGSPVCIADARRLKLVQQYRTEDEARAKVDEMLTDPWEAPEVVILMSYRSIILD